MSSTTIWLTIIGATAVIMAIKLSGHFVPPKWVSSPKISPIVALVSVALLAGLTTTQTLANGNHIVIDPRLAAIAVAAIALWRKAPFIVVVLLAAATAALLRYLGWN